MKVFLDDERSTPEGWVRAFWPDDAIALLRTGDVTELSLDHDLGDDARGTGYTVLLWLEEQVAVYRMPPPLIQVHSANPSARLKMEAAIASGGTRISAAPREPDGRACSRSVSPGCGQRVACAHVKQPRHGRAQVQSSGCGLRPRISRPMSQPTTAAPAGI